MTGDERTPRWGTPHETTAQTPVQRLDDTTVITDRGYASVPTVGAPPPAAPVPAAPVARDDTAARGQTTIADEVVERVIERLVDIAVAEIPGVHSLHSDVERFFGDDSGEGSGRAVAVRLDGDRAEINLAIEVIFGHAVHEAVETLRASLIGSAERLLGLSVAEVNVAVAGVAFPEPEPEPAAG